MILISNLILKIDEGNTIASTDIYGEKVYINIGSGNVFKLKWDPLTLTDNDAVIYYNLVIKRYDPTLNVYYNIFDKNIGLVNEFYIDSSLLPPVPEQYLLHIYLVAHSKQGSVVTSNVVTPYVFKGSGTYVKVQPEGYAQEIMKRAVAFVNTVRQTAAGGVLPEQASQVLVDRNGYALINKDNEILMTKGIDETDIENTFIIKDFAGKTLKIFDETGVLAQVVVTNLLSSTTGWQLAQSSYIKNPEGVWKTTDINYEVLVDKDGEIITDDNDEPIYVL